MLCADNKILIGESSEELNGRHEERREIFESKGLRLSRRDKRNYIEYDFGGNEYRAIKERP